jgi:hypothetical protein
MYAGALEILTSISEDCYVPCRALQLKTRKGTFIRIVWTIIRKVSGTTLLSSWHERNADIQHKIYLRRS